MVEILTFDFDLHLYQIYTELELTERIFEQNNWTILILTFCFVLLAVLRQLESKKFTDFFTIPVSVKYFNVYNPNGQLTYFEILFFLFQLLNLGIFVHFLLHYFHGYPDHPVAILQITTVIAMFILGKIYIEKILANIFSVDGIIQKYLYKKLSYRNLLSILIFSGNLFFILSIQPTPTHIQIFIVFLILLNLFILFNIFRQNWNLIRFNFFYFILYLCALEISPYIILYYLFIKL